MERIIEYFYASHVGKCRRVNQDNFFCDGQMLMDKSQGTDGVCFGKISVKKNPVFCVFDGMGGEECGEIASFLAAESVEKQDFDRGMEQVFREYCLQTNRRICEKTGELGIRSMGTTAAMLRITDGESGLCNVGDSKIFLLADGVFSQLSFDHVGIAAFGKKPPLLQNLGIPEEEMRIDPYIAAGSLREGDTYLLCSDGLTDMVSNARIQQILEENRGQQAAQLLLDEALKNGGKDNITFILLYITKKRFLRGIKL